MGKGENGKNVKWEEWEMKRMGNGQWEMGNGKNGGQWEMGWIGNEWDMGRMGMGRMGNARAGEWEEWKS